MSVGSPDGDIEGVSEGISEGRSDGSALGDVVGALVCAATCCTNPNRTKLRAKDSFIVLKCSFYFSNLCCKDNANVFVS